jgi:hypothetical protein
VIGPDIKLDFPKLRQLKRAMKELPSKVLARRMAEALNRAIKPGETALKALTPRGPTGNLRKSIKRKKKWYADTGNAVALVGYTAAPRKPSNELAANQKGFHAGFLEFGTKKRKTKGSIASSFGKAGGSIKKLGKRKFRTSPKPPKGFVKRADAGEKVDLGKFPVGGKKGIPPVRTAFKKSLGAFSQAMPREGAKSLQDAIKEMARGFPPRGDT